MTGSTLGVPEALCESIESDLASLRSCLLQISSTIRNEPPLPLAAMAAATTETQTAHNLMHPRPSASLFAPRTERGMHKSALMSR